MKRFPIYSKERKKGKNVYKGHKKPYLTLKQLITKIKVNIYIIAREASVFSRYGELKQKAAIVTDKKDKNFRLFKWIQRKMEFKWFWYLPETQEEINGLRGNPWIKYLQQYTSESVKRGRCILKIKISKIIIIRRQ